MALFSTGLRIGMLVTSPFDTLMNDARLKIYKGATIPATADAVLPGDATMMYEFTVDNDGTTDLTFATTAPNGVIQKASAEAWQGICQSAGDMAFFRIYVPSDTGESASTTAPRVQGTVGTAFADLIVADITKALSDPLTLDYFAIAIPVSS